MFPLQWLWRWQERVIWRDSKVYSTSGEWLQGSRLRDKRRVKYIETYANHTLLLLEHAHLIEWLQYSGPSLKGHSSRDTSLIRTELFGIKYCEYLWSSLSPKDTSLMRTELFGRRGVLIRGGPLYMYKYSEILLQVATVRQTLPYHVGSTSNFVPVCSNIFQVNSGSNHFLETQASHYIHRNVFHPY